MSRHDERLFMVTVNDPGRPYDSMPALVWALACSHLDACAAVLERCTKFARVLACEVRS